MGGVTTWRCSLTTRIALGILAFFMFGFAAILGMLPLSLGAASGGWIVILPATVMAGFGVFATFALVAAVKSRLTLSSSTLKATVVSGHNLLLVPRFRNVRLQLAEIRAVERRCELFRSFGFVSMRDALSVVTVAGERIGLFSDTMGNASTFPIDEVAAAIAGAAGISVTDDGTVRTEGSGLYGAALSSWSERPLDDRQAAKARRTAVLTVQICTGLLMLAFLVRAFL
jgi:hypothetical protein